MPRRQISANEISRLVSMILKKEEDQYLYSQRDLERETGFSREYIRKIAKKHGRKFVRTADWVKGQTSCDFCGKPISRSASKISTAKKHYCDENCLFASRGEKKRQRELTIKE